MNDFTQALEIIIALFKLNTPYVLVLIGALWLIQIINRLLGYRLNYLGIYPRSIHGIIGIFLSPFLHGDFTHLFFNTLPLFVLANFLLIGGVHLFWLVTAAITILSGTAVWLVGRPAIHIGASHVIMGYWGYLVLNAYQSRTVITILLACLSLYYFSGLLFNLFPTDVKHSWEGHVLGFIAGIVVGFWLPLNL